MTTSVNTNSYKNNIGIDLFEKKKQYIITCVTTDHEVAGSVPGTSTNFKCGLGLERGSPSIVRTIG